MFFVDFCDQTQSGRHGYAITCKASYEGQCCTSKKNLVSIYKMLVQFIFVYFQPSRQITNGGFTHRGQIVLKLAQTGHGQG